MPDGSDQPVGAAQLTVADEALIGLLAARKTLPAKLLYDDEGCRLFQAITTLPEYYPTRTELALLGHLAPQVAGELRPGSALVEYGASDETKARLLLDAGRFAAYVPIDVAANALSALRSRVRAMYPDLSVHTVEADFLAPFALPDAIQAMPRLGFFPGSTIGNFQPAEAIDRGLDQLAAPGLVGDVAGQRWFRPTTMPRA